MTSSVNVSTVVVANTFDQWRIQTNLLKDDVNEIARGDFVKPTGNVTLTVGRLVLPNATGTMLDVTADARVSGKISVKNIEQDGGAAYLYSDSLDIKFRAGDGTIHANGNTRTRFLYNNTFFSAANINATGFIETTGASNNANLLMNVAGVMTIRTSANSGNVYFANNVSVANIATIGNAVITLANVVTLNANATGSWIYAANIAATNVATPNAVMTRIIGTTANIATLNVAATGATANFANVTLANTTTTNASASMLTVTTRANVVLANIVTANVATLNVAAAGASANIANANIANIVSANVIVTAARATNLNVTTGNIVTLAVESLTLTNPILGPAESDADSYRLRIAQTTRGDGKFGVFQGTTNGNAAIAFATSSNTWQATANDLTTYQTLLTTANVKSTYANESANVASLTLVNSTRLNVEAAYASSNVAANTVRVSAQSASTIHNAQLNFINSASINVLVTTGVTGNANISFTANSSNPALLGPQGIQGVQGTLGVQGSAGFVGSDGAQGAIGAQGSAGSNGTQGAIGAQGIAGSNGSNGTQGAIGAQGLAGTNGTQGLTGAQGIAGSNGSNGAQGIAGSNGSNGSQGAQGAVGSNGTNGSQGATGATGPSTAINASAYSSGTHYPVMVAGTGTNQTPRACTSIFYYSAGTTYSTDFAATSDARLKTVLGFVDGAVEIVEQLNGIKYVWNDLAANLGYESSHPGGVELGVLAQEVEAVLPEAVYKDDKDYLHVSYDKLVPVLIEAIKELNARIKVLEAAKE